MHTTPALSNIQQYIVEHMQKGGRLYSLYLCNSDVDPAKNGFRVRLEGYYHGLSMKTIEALCAKQVILPGETQEIAPDLLYQEYTLAPEFQREKEAI